MSSIYEDMKLVGPSHIALSTPCDLVENVQEEVREFVPYLIRTMRRGDGMSISAPQIGISKAVFITNVIGDHIRIFINPSIKETSSKEIMSGEGCLTFPRRRIRRQRKRHVILHALNLKEEQFFIDTRYKIYSPQTSALLAVVLQHEMDHINGVDFRQS